MKDKAARLRKRKRRYERLQNEQTENALMMESFRRQCKEHGVKSRAGIVKINRAHREVQREIGVKMNLICQVSMLTYLRRRCRWGQQRLFVFMCRATRWTANAYAEDKNAIRMLDELKLDYGCDIIAEWERWMPGLRGSAVDKEQQNMMYKYMPPIMAIAVYTIKSFGYGKKRLNRLLPEFCAIAKDMIRNNNIKAYRDRLAECGFRIDGNGHFWADKIKEERLESELKELRRYVAA